ncbi:MAG: hypothetical protein KJO29_10805, partial [Bacteroidia bacterium]|nr:hypothetical protein [Bacteroidia bacterium]
MKNVIFILAMLYCSLSTVYSQTLISTNASWKYLDDGSDQGTAWRATGFNDTSWQSGNAEL